MDEVIELKTNEDQGTFSLKVNDKIEAKLTFTFRNQDKISIDHTEVNPNNQGKGFGKKLIEEAIKYSRTKKLTILPYCSFAKKVLENNPEFADVL
jgi:hypothetical protein